MTSRAFATRATRPSVRAFPYALCALGGALFVFTAAPSARADASAWAYLGGGAMSWKTGETPATWGNTMQLDAGVGTTPDGPFIVGGLFRIAPIFGEGSDLSLLGRVATHGFQAGDFGVALDLGGYERFWGEGSAGFSGGIVLGAPFGLQLAAETLVGNHEAFAYGFSVGIDLLRLTVYRQSTLDYWPNPKPAQERTAGTWLGSF